MNADLIGRAAELEAVDRFLERARATFASLLIDGDAGIGKTAIWRAAVERRGRARGPGPALGARRVRTDADARRPDRPPLGRHRRTSSRSFRPSSGTPSRSPSCGPSRPASCRTSGRCRSPRRRSCASSRTSGRSSWRSTTPNGSTTPRRPILAYAIRRLVDRRRRRPARGPRRAGGAGPRADRRRARRAA